MPTLSTDSNVYVCVDCINKAATALEEPVEMEDVEQTDFLIAACSFGGLFDTTDHSCENIFTCRCTCDPAVKIAASQVRH